MCGIAALFAYAENAAPLSLAELRAIRDCMAPRGPDGTGEWLAADNRVGLGHRRLSIIDLRAVADQPMANHDGRLQIVFNGEIYNYRALRAELVAQGYAFRTESDTEVILNLYDRDGAACVSKLRGMFAFALYDSKRNGMLLARDPLGIKPLYIADDGRTLRIASQVKALLVSSTVDRRPQPAGHVGFFLWGNIPDPFTLFRGIKALPAGHTQWIDRQGSRTPQRFWSLARTLANTASTSLRPGERREALREALIDSLRHHFVADVPVGVFLSAGIDSTTIAALAAEDHATNLVTLTLGFREFEGTENDETRLAEMVAQQRNTTHTTCWVLGKDFAQAREALLTAMDQPSIDGVNTYFVARAARTAGLKVALSGLGGDEMFAGYPSFHDVPRIVRLAAPIARHRGLARFIRALSAPIIGRFTSPKYAGLFEYGSSYAKAYALRRCLFMPWEIADVLPDDPVLVEDGFAELDTFASLEREIDDIDNPRLRVTALEMSWYMRHQLLRDSDWAGMAHSLEIRVPFVDATLVERLAPLLAANNPPGKGDLADACETPLPFAVRHRPKTGFVVPVRDWLQGEPGGGERGLRGWARAAYAAQTKAAA